MSKIKVQARGVVAVTFDTEQIWGYHDLLGEAKFEQCFPNSPQTALRLLDVLCENHLSATWPVVGAMCLAGSEGLDDERMRGLPAEWIGRIRAGDEASAPLWYARSFVERLRDAAFYQEIGLHGGLTHLIWKTAPGGIDTLRTEISGGVAALGTLGIQPTSFTFPRNAEAHHELLLEHGIRCYRGLGPALGERLGGSPLRPVVRAISAMSMASPPPVWPEERLPGLWNIPGSLLPYRMSGLRLAFVPPVAQLRRVRHGIEAAARTNQIFHLWLHPENLTESPRAFDVFERAVRQICKARKAGDIEVLTMTQIAERMENGAVKGRRERIAV